MSFKNKLKKNLFTIITLTIALVVLLYFLFTQNGGITALARVFATLHPGWLLMAVACAAAYWVLEGVSNNLFCKHIEPGWSFGRSFSIGMTGLLYSALTPFSTGGQPMQIYAMNRMGMDPGKASSVIAMKTVVFQVAMVLYSLVAVAVKLPFFQSNVSNLSFVTIIGLVSNSVFITSILLFIFSEKITDRLLRLLMSLLYKLHLSKHPVQRYKKIRRQFVMFHNSAKLMGNSPRLYASTAVLTVAQLTVNSLVPFFIYLSFGLPSSAIDPFTMVAALVFVNMVSAFTPLPGASGGAEVVFALFFGIFFGPSIGAALLLWRIISFYFNILFGGVFNYWGQRKYYLPSPEDKH